MRELQTEGEGNLQIIYSVNTLGVLCLEKSYNLKIENKVLILTKV